MDRNSPKTKPDAPKSATGPIAPRETLSTNVNGRVTHDDRGNAVWEWAVSTGKFGADLDAQRLKKLDTTNLSLAEETPLGPASTVQQNPHGTLKGYSPYESGVLEKKAAPKKKTDLRKLSEWMKLKKQAESNKSGAD